MGSLKNIFTLFIKKIFIVLIFFFLKQFSYAQKIKIDDEHQVLNAIKDLSVRKFSKHPDAQWFKDNSNLGLFLHWGPGSVAGVETSWGMFRDMQSHPKKPKDVNVWPIENYFDLAKEFNPQNYDPDKWMAAAKRAGFTYAVLVTRHHDGFALWPSEYGDYSTKNYMKGRDLVKDFVEACKKYDIKVGLYYSPTDWYFSPEGYPHNGYPYADPEFKYCWYTKEKPKGWQQFVTDSKKEQQKIFDKFLFPYVKGQVKELLTNYGKIDMIWWDGYSWPASIDVHAKEMFDMVLELQPGIVINPRYESWMNYENSPGHYTTVEGGFTKAKPESDVWEYCNILRGYWGYTPVIPDDKGKSPGLILKTRSHVATWGGNWLPAIGPKPDGTMPQYFYDLCDELEKWNSHSSIAFTAKEGPYPEKCSHPVTVDNNIWYVFSNAENQNWNWSKADPGNAGQAEKKITFKGEESPKIAKLLHSGENLPIEKTGENEYRITIPKSKSTPLVDVVQITW